MASYSDSVTLFQINNRMVMQSLRTQELVLLVQQTSEYKLFQNLPNFPYHFAAFPSSSLTSCSAPLSTLLLIIFLQTLYHWHCSNSSMRVDTIQYQTDMNYKTKLSVFMKCRNKSIPSSNFYCVKITISFKLN